MKKSTKNLKDMDQKSVFALLDQLWKEKESDFMIWLTDDPDFLYSIADLDHVKEKLCDHCDQRIPDEPMRDEGRD